MDDEPSATAAADSVDFVAPLACATKPTGCVRLADDRLESDRLMDIPIRDPDAVNFADAEPPLGDLTLSTWSQVGGGSSPLPCLLFELGLPLLPMPLGSCTAMCGGLAVALPAAIDAGPQPEVVEVFPDRARDADAVDEADETAADFVVRLPDAELAEEPSLCCC